MTIKMTTTNIDNEESWHNLDTIEQARKVIEVLIGLDGSYGQIEGTRTCEPDLGAKVTRDWIMRADGNAYAILTNCRLSQLFTEKERGRLAYQKGHPAIYPQKLLAIRVRRERFSSFTDASLGMRSHVIEQFSTFTEADERYDALLPSYQ